MLWARHCQASYPVRGQQAMFNAVVCVKGAVGLANSVDPGQTAPEGAVWSEVALFVQTYMSQYLEFTGCRKYLSHIAANVFFFPWVNSNSE